MRQSLAQLKSLVVLALALSPLGVQATPVEAQWSCLEPALDQELTGKLNFQEDFAELVAQERHELSEIAYLTAAATIERFKVRHSQIAWLWKTDRSRLSHSDAFWTYRWNAADDAAWRRANQEHIVMDDRIEALRAQIRSHPDAPKYRQYGSENRAKEPFLTLITEFAERSNADRQAVANCY